MSLIAANLCFSSGFPSFDLLVSVLMNAIFAPFRDVPLQIKKLCSGHASRLDPKPPKLSEFVRKSDGERIDRERPVARESADEWRLQEPRRT